MRTTVRLPPELLERARRKAAAEGTTLTALIEAGLRSIVAETKPKTPTGRKMPRIFKGGGGLTPGYDWATLARQTEEAEDLERLQRIELQS